MVNRIILGPQVHHQIKLMLQTIIPNSRSVDAVMAENHCQILWTTTSSKHVVTIIPSHPVALMEGFPIISCCHKAAGVAERAIVWGSLVQDEKSLGQHKQVMFMIDVHYWCSLLMFNIDVQYWCSWLMFIIDVHYWCSVLMFIIDVHHWWSLLLVINVVIDVHCWCLSLMFLIYDYCLCKLLISIIASIDVCY